MGTFNSKKSIKIEMIYKLELSKEKQQQKIKGQSLVLTFKFI